MLFEQMEPNERFRARREEARRRRRRRRAVAFGLLLGVTATATLGARFVIDGRARHASAARRSSRAAAKPAAKPVAVKQPRALPDEVRGIHVTMALASLDGKLAEYLKLANEGMNTIQLDVKDENGEIGFIPSAVPLATKVGAARPYYRPREAARLAHRKGVYLIGRVVTFEDPRLSEGKPEYAIKNPDGSVWHNHAGLGWTNPYDKRVWDYNVSIAEVAARAGFDEIQFDYVRFPTDGDVDSIVYPKQDGDGARLGDRAVRPLRAGAAEAARRPRLGRRLRPRRPRATSASARSRGGSRSTSTRSTRWSTRRTTARASTASRIRTRRPARRSSGRSPTSGAR